MQFNVSDISKYRPYLMGIATLLVIFGHSAGNGVVMPGWVESLCGLASVGVDIFLLVSGLGLWHSLRNLKAEKLIGGIKAMVCKKIQKNTCSISVDNRFSKYFVCFTWQTGITGIVESVNNRLLDKSSRSVVHRYAYSSICNHTAPLQYQHEGKTPCIVFYVNNCGRCFGIWVGLSDRKQ